MAPTARTALLSLAVAAAFAGGTPAHAACTEPNLDCVLLDCGPRIDEENRISWVPC